MMQRRMLVSAALVGPLAVCASCALLGSYGFDGHFLEPDGSADAFDKHVNDASADGSDGTLLEADASVDVVDATRAADGATCAADALGADDAHNCGACGHDCLGGVCYQEECQPWAIARMPGTWGLALSGSTVLWSTGLADGGIYAAPVDGGANIPLGPSAWPYTVVADSTTVYWLAGYVTGRVWQCPIAGCGGYPDLVQPALYWPRDIALTDAAVYWTEADLEAGTGNVWRASRSIAFPDAGVLFGPLALPWGITTDGPFLYWLSGGPPPYSNGSVMRASADGTGSPVPLVAGGQNTPNLIVAYGGNLYWTNYGDTTASDGSVMTCSAANCSTTAVAIAKGQAQPFGIAVDGSGVYWTNSANVGGTVMRCGPPCTPDACQAGAGCTYSAIAGAQQRPLAIALDAVSVYWTVVGAVMRMAKPP
jgi:hypothetical protein